MYVTKRQNPDIAFADGLRICHQGYAEIFLHKGRDGVFIRGLADEIRGDSVGRKYLPRIFSQTGAFVIPNQRIGAKFRQGNRVFGAQRMSLGRDDGHILVDNRNKLNIWFVFHIGTEHKVKELLFQSFNQLGCVELMEAEGNVLIAFLA